MVSLQQFSSTNANNDLVKDRRVRGSVCKTEIGEEYKRKVHYDHNLRHQCLDYPIVRDRREDCVGRRDLLKV